MLESDFLRNVDLLEQVLNSSARDGLGLDHEMRRQTEQTVSDRVNNTYYDGIDDVEWLDATLKSLGR